MTLPRIAFDRNLIKELYSLDDPITYEMALPSYFHWNPLIRLIVAWRMQIALDMMGDLQGKTILDYGCGLGILFLQIEPGISRLLGTDLDILPAQQILAAHGREDVGLFPVERVQQSLPDHSLDVITSLEVLEHVGDLAAVVGLFQQKLVPGGRLVVTGPTENVIYGWLRKVAGFRGDYHQRNIYDIRGEITRGGFSVARQRTIPLPKPFDLFVIYEFVLE